jgi:hypothetical protein
MEALMLDLVIETYRDALQWIFDVWNSIELAEGVTIWSLILAGILSFGLVQVIIQRFGGSVSTEISDTYHTSQRYSDEAANKKAIAAREAEKQSYSYYEKNRERKEAYSSMYKSRHR